jgi:hypothetical protein
MKPVKFEEMFPSASAERGQLLWETFSQRIAQRARALLAEGEK